MWPAECWPRCATAEDCGNPADPTMGADNYACVDGACKWNGCNSTAECVDLHGEGWECLHNGAEYPGCWQTCTVTDDCIEGQTCIGGLCWFICSDAVCQQVSPDRVCR
jgi:hypothetical protein